MQFKKFLTVIPGIITAAIFIFILAPFVKAAAAFLMPGDNNVSVAFNGFIVSSELLFNGRAGFITYFLISLSPLIFCIFAIEIASMIFRKSITDYIKTGMLAFIIINTGYIIFNVMYGTLSLLLPGISSGWKLLFQGSGISYNQSLIIMLIMLLFILGYVNITGRRLKRNLPVEIKNKGTKNESIKK